MVVGVVGVVLRARGERDRGRRTLSESNTTFFEEPPADFLAVVLYTLTMVG